MKALQVIRYVVSLAVLTFWHGLQVMVAALVGVKHRPGGIYDRAARNWGRRLLWSNGVAVDASGREHLTPGTSYVYASNHVSFADIWVLFAVLPGSVRFVAKKELLSVPFFGRAVRASGQIPIDRANLRDAFAAYDAAAMAVRGGLSAIVFAEGTRSRDGALREFKKGPFVLAIAAGAPVVPVLLQGTRDVLPPGGWWVRPGRVRVKLIAPVQTAGLTFEDRDAVLDAVRASMLAD